MAKITNQSQITSKYTLPDHTQQDNTTFSNEIHTENMTLSFKKEKTTQKTFGFAGDEILQTITLTNESDLTITAVGIQETISQNGEFKEGSVKIDGTIFDGYNITNGFTAIDTLAPNQKVEISYVLTLKPTPAPEIPITAVSKINYLVDTLSFTENTNEISISVVSEKIVINQTADKIAVIKGQTITFENTISNEGSLENTDIVFQSTLPPELEFVENSVQIDGEYKNNLNPNLGFSLNNLAPKSTTIVNFKALVK